MRHVLSGLSGARRLAGASGVLLAGRIAGAAASFVFAVMLARTLPQPEVGLALTAISSAFLASVLITLNVESGSIRFLVAAREAQKTDAVGGFIYFGRLLLLCMAPIVVSGYAVLAIVEGNAARTVVIACAAASIPAMGWLRLSGSHATALGKPAIGSLPRTALQPLLLLILFPLSLAAGAAASAELALGCFLASFVATAVVQFVLIRKHIGPGASQRRDFSDWREWLANGFFMSPIILLQEYLQHGVVIAAAIALNASEVALLAISLRFISLVRFGILAVNMAASPALSRAVARADHSERDKQLRAAALLKAPAAALACLVIAFLAEPILALFGPDYVGGGKALAWFTLIPLSSAVFGPNQLLLNISGARSWVFGVSLGAILLAFIAIPAAGTLHGVEGAAMAASLAFAAWEAALFVTVRTKFGVDASLFAVFGRRI